jgi:hypothetical protein
MATDSKNSHAPSQHLSLGEPVKTHAANHLPALGNQEFETPKHVVQIVVLKAAMLFAWKSSSSIWSCIILFDPAEH